MWLLLFVLHYVGSCSFQEILKNKGYLVGAIRQPTVKSAIIRLIAKIDIDENELINVSNLLKDLKNAN